MIVLFLTHPSSNKDLSGEIHGTLHRKILDVYSTDELSEGAVLVLRQVSVFSPTARKHYLNITPDNIMRHFPPEVPGESNRLPDKHVLSLNDDTAEESQSTITTHEVLTPVSSAEQPYTSVAATQDEEDLDDLLAGLDDDAFAD